MILTTGVVDPGFEMLATLQPEDAPLSVKSVVSSGGLGAIS